MHISLASGLALTLSANVVFAFSVSSAITTPCHEPITMEALRAARLSRPGAAPLLPENRNDRALITDLPFKPDEDMNDLGAVALLLGVRDNDLKGRDPNELDSIALVHGEPDSQREHCLRAPGDDEPNGTQNALIACRGFIREMFLEALNGLDGEGRPTLETRMSLPVGLSLRGKLSVELPMFYVRIGQGMHALQDGFTHTYRPADRVRVSAALNYVDVVDRDYVPERDGPKHSMEMDDCTATDPLRSRNRALALEASTAMLTIGLDETLNNDQKMAEFEALLDKHLGFEPGCTDPNGWCDAPEAEIEAAKGCGCNAGGGWMGLAALVFVAARRIRRGALAAGLVVLCLGVPLTARAQSAEPAPVHTEEAAAVGTTVPITAQEVQDVQKEEAHKQSLLAISLGGSGSLYNVAAAGALGVRLRMSERWQLGLDAELNGWYGIHAQKMRTGATNVYLSLIFRVPLKFEPINLRSSVQLGVAVQMLDLVGVPSGSVGLFAGLNPIGVEIKLSNHFYLIFYPLGFALPVTQLKGAPFAFVQFRTSLALEVAF